MGDEQHDSGSLGEVIRELGMGTELAGDRMIGRSTISPEMWAPGSDTIRLSVLATWADVLTGVLANLAFRPRIGLTVDLDVHVLRPVPGTGDVRGVASTLKVGRSITVNRADFTVDDDPRPFATAIGSFMVSPNPAHLLPDDFSGTKMMSGVLTAPLAERAGVRPLGPGVAEVPGRRANLNSSHAIQGGLLALCAEEAVLSLVPQGILTSMSMRYLRGFRTGPAHAHAVMHDGVAMIEIVDPADGRLGVTASAHLGPSARGVGGT